jgi:hypothetical protein
MESRIDDDQWQIEVAGQIGVERRVAQRREQPARSFDDHDVAHIPPCVESAAEERVADAAALRAGTAGRRDRG